MSNGDRIRAWRTANDLTLSELADKVGTSKAYLSQIENGLRPASEAIIVALRALGLVLESKQEVKRVSVRSSGDVIVPLYRTSVRAGTGAPIFEEDVEQFNVTEHYSGTVVYEVSGDSMHGAGIMEGDRVIARRGHRFRNRDIIVCSFNGELMVKGAMIRGSEVWLVPFNSHMHPWILKETDQFECKGVVVEIIKKPNRDVWQGVTIPTT